ncbi:MAG: hypothetical protein ACOC5F_06065 [Candidatus Aminicenantaceae bacterium]
MQLKCRHGIKDAYFIIQNFIFSFRILFWITIEKPRASHVFHFDLEDEELLDFPWHEDEDPPPVVKPEEKKRRKNNSPQQIPDCSPVLFLKLPVNKSCLIFTIKVNFCLLYLILCDS